MRFVPAFWPVPRIDRDASTVPSYAWRVRHLQSRLFPSHLFPVACVQKEKPSGPQRACHSCERAGHADFISGVAQRVAGAHDSIEGLREEVRQVRPCAAMDGRLVSNLRRASRSIASLTSDAVTVKPC